MGLKIALLGWVLNICGIGFTITTGDIWLRTPLGVVVSVIVSLVQWFIVFPLVIFGLALYLGSLLMAKMAKED